jgi:hypothetical protein
MGRRVYLYWPAVRKLAAIALLLAPALHAQFSPKPPDAVVPVVGSIRGLAGSNFKTELQLTNPGGTRMEGWIVLQPDVIARRYELAPRATLSFADVVSDLGTTGLLSLDIYADHGAVPTVVARAYDDQPDGTTGVTVPAVRTDEVLARNDVAALIVPRDLTLYRFNIGVRALDTGATIQFAVRDAAGNERHYFDLTLSANQFLQRAGDLLAGTPLRADDSIEVKIAAGSAIVYATTVDNRTNDSSIQVLRK